jgi:DNA primase catalytic core
VTALVSISFEEAIEKVRTSLNIVEVVGKHVALKRHGRNLMGLCPFHKEKSPSFTVHGEKGLYKCFGCGAGGDAIKFLMETERQDFAEVIEGQAKLLGYQVRRSNNPEEVRRLAQKKERHERLQEWMRLAQGFFHQQLHDAMAGDEARRYIAKRALPAPLVAQFGLGVAPSGWDQLRKHLTAVSGVPAAEVVADLEALGLIIPRKAAVAAGGTVDPDGYYDRFRTRLMVPIMDAQGAVIAFAGRVLRVEDSPKYMNSPETPLYNKSEVLFGLPQAKDTIIKTQSAVVVEGYLDVMRLHQFGATNAVACCGTALTEQHLRRLARLGVRRLYLGFDNDDAGQKAAWSALDTVGVLSAEPGSTFRMDVLVVRWPDAKDADEALSAFGDDVMGARAMIRRATEAAWTPGEFRCHQVVATFAQEAFPEVALETFWAAPVALMTPQKVVMLGRRLVETLATYVPDTVEQAALAPRFAGLLGVPPEVLLQEVARATVALGQAAATGGRGRRPAAASGEDTTPRPRLADKVSAGEELSARDRRRDDRDRRQKPWAGGNGPGGRFGKKKPSLKESLSWQDDEAPHSVGMETRLKSRFRRMEESLLCYLLAAPSVERPHCWEALAGVALYLQPDGLTQKALSVLRAAPDLPTVLASETPRPLLHLLTAAFHSHPVMAELWRGFLQRYLTFVSARTEEGCQELFDRCLNPGARASLARLVTEFSAAVRLADLRAMNQSMQQLERPPVGGDVGFDDGGAGQNNLNELHWSFKQLLEQNWSLATSSAEGVFTLPSLSPPTAPAPPEHPPLPSRTSSNEFSSPAHGPSHGHATPVAAAVSAPLYATPDVDAHGALAGMSLPAFDPSLLLNAAPVSPPDTSFPEDPSGPSPPVVDPFTGDPPSC